ncbi:MAG: LuxR family transcriptional regulator, partial [Acidimicrobiales bacterium]
VTTARKVHAQASKLVPAAAGMSVQAAQLVSRGLLESVDGDVNAALRSLSSAAEIIEAAPVGHSLGDTPHALAASLACMAGEYQIADSLLGRAIEAGIGGPAVRCRHQLLRSFARMSSGDWSGVFQLLEKLDPAQLATRDELVYRALQVGLARRTSDIVALHGCWREAHDVMMRHPVDLFALAQFGELLVAGARLGEMARLAPWGEARDELLDALGDPVLWKMHADWADLQAAAACDDAARTEAAAAALALLEAPTVRLEVLAEAANEWGQVLAKKVDVARVQVVADHLHDAGFRWEAARLVGMAALRSTDEGGAKKLLAKARELRKSLAIKLTDESSVAALLSERELEVAAGLVDGHTYKEIGAILFISP